MKQYTRQYEIAFAFTLDQEGGYVNDPTDPGGETKYGVSKRWHPDIDIKNLTVDQAKRILFDEHWIGGECERLTFPIGCMHFDTCVLCGNTAAAKILQNAANALTHDDSKKLKVDGIVGPLTVGRVNELVYEKFYQMCFEYVMQRIMYHLMSKHPRKGWFYRCIDLVHEYIYPVDRA